MYALQNKGCIGKINGEGYYFQTKNIQLGWSRWVPSNIIFMTQEKKQYQQFDRQRDSLGRHRLFRQDKYQVHR